MLLRNRVKRLKLDVPEGRLVERILRRTLHLSTKSPPAVQAVYIRTILNGWVTHRRMRNCANLINLSPVCVLCKQGNDSLEHLAKCKIVVSFFATLNIHVYNLETFFGLDKSSFPECTATVARGICAVYLARNVLIHGSSMFQPQTLIKNMFIQLDA
jgi:hypothetical protein